MKKITFLIISMILCLKVFGQEESYYWTELVVSIHGSTSVEKRPAPKIYPITAYFEVKRDSIYEDSILVKAHFMEFEENNSEFYLGTLTLYEKSIENQNMRDVYLEDKFVSKIDQKVWTTDWIRLSSTGGLYINQVSECGFIYQVGIFFR